MSELQVDTADTRIPRWLPWVFLGLLVLPLHPYWVDFEQVRRGLLLVLAGATALLWPRLPRVRGENAFFTFLAFLAVCAVISIKSLQPWETVYRLAHWLALLVVLRLGAATQRGFATPIAVLLLLTSVYGILQRLGLAEFCGYGVEREPVSVFGNLNVASEWTAIAAMATAAFGTANLAPRRAWLSRLAIALAGAYLVVNQSRSGMIALPIGLFVLAIQQRRALGALPLLLAVLGAGGGYLISATVARPPTFDAIAQAAERNRATATLEVRREIARSCTTLFAERPLFGWGPGQFAVQYPRVRSQKEIELSSPGRQFATEVRTAHDDWLELLVDGGLPALGLFAGMLFALQRGNRQKVRLLPLFVLMMMMFVRAPLGNAPAIAAAMLLVGSEAPILTTLPRWLPWLHRGIGLLLMTLGLLPILANTLFAPYQWAKAHGEPPPRSAITRAVACMPWEPRWLQILAQEQLLAGELAAARKNAARALQLRPHEPQLFLLVGEVLAQGTAYKEAAALATAALAIDPPNPELRVLLSTVRLQQRDIDGAIAAVVENPHPALRTRLQSHFRQLERLADRLDYPEGAARCAIERTCLELTETLGVQTQEAQFSTNDKLKELVVQAKRAGTSSRDVRLFALHAVQALDAGDRDTATQFAKLAKQKGATFEPWQRDLLGDTLKPLANNEAWRALLR
ncbi:MAG: O-antigen ligase family protein [Planctomycetes bacterium]|nr:O-antigen ligase family protein [Planctomycetota bacterium]